jgi:hypothetical protein
MTGDIWGMLGKKKSTSITIPAKKTTNSSNNTTPAKPVNVKPPRVKAHKKQKVQVQQHSQTQHSQTQQTQQPDLNNYGVSTTGDANGIYISILYDGRPIYRFTLPKQDFDLLQYRMDANQRLQYVTVRVNANAIAFGNNAK